ncbi:hypothetical protein FOXG_16298 [Fusarium oxysporum f. sp. lycopersici 4287]|uniref:Uncharacterized protein n=1 Tax=Fusarium oxysporum f. sp. lycopersici (strain 4287 / CBS 123668 / FGSC 9935 / NRRL 34936) TaxID=426428 RepID=A0A0J9W7G0_FUSO4|nr:hypothetical protein FOXG_06930 [Fusarium oxysporum f. sp. lycopersici 4287]XP_018256616.1 hypothetical protein FOXG_16080 [Fusarium oxysporum f. sp. lycopersici 4287]XP_018256940.1 hypothetical protein FOXG_16298 [Fusarium oxysporum f. sp. lycopersici 4287]KAJ9412385.1 hypothetical protein QL093DRAFT_1155561 [Fusarium oxysporum]KNB04962.1 hypothetical protein FOXG_06930 [Fusarium oxysporum f. sp. lycopersici 4287]KNB18571.1 hypothetical protein FOXG_16080 [Fusarium oxysporum f. sp. lycoper
MPFGLDTHFLTVDANAIYKVNTGDLTNLYSMLTVFSRCGDSIEHGRRLENFSWRSWPILKKETFVVYNEETTAPTPETLPQNISSGSSISDLPQLSDSVASLVDEEALDFTSVSAPLEVARPRVRRTDSYASTGSKRGCHISSGNFREMIVSIVEDNGLLSAPPPVAPITKESLTVLPACERSGSDSQSPVKSTAASEGSPKPSPQSPPLTTFVRGFHPRRVSISRTTGAAQSSDAIPEPKSSLAAKVAQSKKPTRFALGGSCSSSEQDQSFGNSKSSIPIIKKPVCQIGDSSEEDGSMKSAMASSRPNPLLSARKKQASFSNNVMTRTIDDEAAVDSDTDDYIDESAIDDDDDSSDWEDAMGESGKSSMDHKFFQRVDSKPNLTSRRSLITLMFAENDRARNLGNHASHSTSAILRSRTAHGLSLGASRHDSDAAPLMMKGKRLPGLKPIHVPRPNAQTIMTGPQHIQPQAALSPRTTRRNMLGTELTESLRRHLLWERQVKSSTANAVLKRRHTSHGVADLKQYPEKSCMKKSEDVNASSWNRYFSKEATDGYHSKGW